MLKKLCEKGIFQNAGGVVTALISKDEFYAIQSEQFVNETFGGSLPAFIAAFTKRQSISEEQAEELRRIIDRIAKEG